MCFSATVFRKLPLFGLFFISFIAFSQAPKATLMGVVTDKAKEPLLGASVVLKGTSKGVVTDGKGRFSLSVPAGKYQIEVRFLGYNTQQKQVQVQADEKLSLVFTLEEEAVEVKGITVEAHSLIKQVQKSAYNVVAIEAKDLEHTNTTAADILAKASGVKVRETGGVGAEQQINLNGFTGRHVRTFVDGVPLNRANSSFQLGNIPAELIDRIEIYKGVVPIAFGSDALGGAVNIITRRNRADFASLSYTYGSFNTHKSTLNAGTRLTDNIAIELNAYQNYSDNSYKVYTQFLNLDSGIFSRDKQWFRRFHDRYHNEAIIGKVNIFGEAWADKLSIGLNYNQEYKQIQNANLMQIVFGGKYRTSYTYSSFLEYEKKNLLQGLNFSLQGRYDLTTTKNADEEARQYSWDGSYRNKRTKGEMYYMLQTFEGKSAYIASHLMYIPSEKHLFQLSNVYNHYRRQTTDNVVTLATTEADYMPRTNEKNITGLSYKYTHSERWNLLAFAKYYHTKVTGPVQIGGRSSDPIYEEQSRTSNPLGYGIAGTYLIAKDLQTKLSYEKSYRLPTDRELFGDGDLEQGEGQLKPEHSQNLNLNLSYQPSFGAHSLLIEGGFAYRNIKDYIIRNISSRGTAISKNHGEVLNLGGDLSLRYFYKETFALGGNVTYMDIRNKERKTATGANSIIYNDRLPNTPYLFASADASYTLPTVFTQSDALSLEYNLNFTKEFYLTWQSEGAKLSVPNQLSHDVSLTYSGKNKRYTLSLEVRNFTDALLYDNYSLQKAGRAFYGKISYRL